MSAQIAQLQEDRAQYQEQLDLVLASLNDDPGNDELLALKAELQSALEIIDDSMAELKPEPTTSSKTESHTRTPADSSSTQSAAQAHTQAHEDTAPVVYKVNESILARWVTGDKGFYPARIMSVTGSATAPMYTVKFKSYDTIETLRARDIRSIAPPNSNSGGSSASSSATKRKADGSSVGAGDAAASHRGSATPLSPPTSTATPPPPPPAAVPAPPQPPQTSQSYGQPPPPPPPSSTPAVVAAAPPVSTAIPPPSRFRTIDRFSQGVVSSAQPQLYNKPPSQQQQQQQQQWSSGGAVTNAGSSSGPATNATPLGEEPPVKKFKKIKANKQLEAGKSKWQEFSSKGKTGKPGTKKDSMFRTPDGPQGRVGFIGSGQAMRKDVTRSRHIYQTNDDVD